MRNFQLIIFLLAKATSFAMALASQKVVILGGGIHGASVAYYLAEKFNTPSLIIEQSFVAAAASGKSGGFLARSWGSGPTKVLHEKSYDLHRELAIDLKLSSYRELPTLSVAGGRSGKNIASWLDRKSSSDLMGGNTAQVTSSELVEKMIQCGRDKGMIEVMIDTAIGIEKDDSGKVTGIQLKERGLLPTDTVVLCLGPWTGVAVEDWFGLSLPMEGIKSTSVVFQDVEAMRKEPFACFCEEDENGCHMELYPRPNGELYICGLGGSDYVKGDRLRPGGDCERAESVAADPRRVSAAMRSLRGITSTCDREPDISQACMRPCTPDALPVMGAIPGFPGAFVSAGHNCWGILWAPVSGLSMAQLIKLGEAKAINLAPFSPNRYMRKAIQGRGKKIQGSSVGEQW